MVTIMPRQHCLNCKHCGVDVVGLICLERENEYVNADDSCAFWTESEEEEEDA